MGETINGYPIPGGQLWNHMHTSYVVWSEKIYIYIFRIWPQVKKTRPEAMNLRASGGLGWGFIGSGGGRKEKREMLQLYFDFKTTIKITKLILKSIQAFWDEKIKNSYLEARDLRMTDQSSHLIFLSMWKKLDGIWKNNPHIFTQTVATVE